MARERCLLQALRGSRHRGLRTHPDPKGGVPVRMDGRVSLLHIGDVEAVGFTLTQLADYLKVLFATVYDDPVVTVVLEQSNSRRYTVMGKVANPGIFYLDYPINLVQVVARCGGFTEWANLELTVVREGAGKGKIGDRPRFF
jgi:polysaccharide export outer membrane protein